VFCTEAQITEEAGRVCQLLLDIYRGFGFDNVLMKLADRPPKRVGADEVWDRAEAALQRAMQALGLDYTLNKGEGAFYGPKIEFVLRDAIGRDWQCGTLQVDLNLPARLNATYIGEDGNRHTPVLLHRAILGSLERFIGILLEHYAGALPFWLAPTQVLVATITSDADEYARHVVERLTAAGLRADLDLRNEKINYKVREHSLAKVPAIIAVGKREVAEGTVALRRLGQQTQSVLPLAQAVEDLLAESAARGRIPAEAAA
jgi:threonyl-tRNA synthetase